MRKLLFLLMTVVVLLARPAAQVGDVTQGWLVIEGGSYPLDATVLAKFRELLGGPNAKVLVIPTALGDSDLTAEALANAGKDLGLPNVEVFHTRDRAQADSEEFAARIRSARGVWFGGGRPGRLAETYLGTRTHRELEALYKRGGVIGGSSAGAMILSSFLIRGGVENDDFKEYVSKTNRVGLGFLANAAIDVHIGQRPNGEADLAPVVAAHPGLLGIGVEAGTSAVVHGNQLEVVGRPLGRVAITDGRLHDGKPYYFLKQGDRFDLTRREVIAR